LRNQLIAAAIMDLFSGSEKLIKEIMSNAQDIAFTMAELSYHVHGISADEAFLAGIFHHAGALLLASKDCDKYQKVFDQSKSFPYRSIDQEREIIGGTHNAAGVIMAKKWQLPLFLIQVVYEHHKMGFVGIKDEKTKLLVALIALATYIVAETSLGAYIGNEMICYADDAKETLMLEESVIKQVRMTLQSYSL
jgi:HD-like signal output (HDOD) protein